MATDGTTRPDPSPRGGDRRGVEPERPSHSWAILVGAELAFWGLVLLVGLVHQWLG